MAIYRTEGHRGIKGSARAFRILLAVLPVSTLIDLRRPFKRWRQQSLETALFLSRGFLEYPGLWQNSTP